jgi:hypothetical protein
LNLFGRCGRLRRDRKAVGERPAGTTVDHNPRMAKTRKRPDAEALASPDQSEAGRTTTATASAVGSESERVPDAQRISQRAYEIYLARGGADGQAWEDWLAAERELTADSKGDTGE